MEVILILGIGNVLLSDEGIGVHVVRELGKEELPDDVHLLDGGTGGFHLLEIFQKYRKIILIDAAIDGKKPGTITLLQPRFAKDFPQTLSSHEIGLRDLIHSAALLGNLPEIDLITVSIPDDQPLSMDLSDEVAGSLADVKSLILQLLKHR